MINMWTCTLCLLSLIGAVNSDVNGLLCHCRCQTIVNVCIVVVNAIVVVASVYLGLINGVVLTRTFSSDHHCALCGLIAHSGMLGITTVTQWHLHRG